MLIRQTNKITENDVTPQEVYLNRRSLMKGLVGLGLAGAATPAAALLSPQETDLPRYSGPEWLQPKLKAAKTTIVAADDVAPYEACITHNNFYEFGTGKSDPFERAQGFNTDPWKVEVSGEVENPGVYNLEDLLAKVDLEERIYRLRCVEAWSMVIPWIGFELGKLLKQFN
ncbi:MAG: molybdopterin-dependent oxidoreductase, partial [Oceanospirillaceae bacterium]|nr:molybdopterin-dependent oxidoreductase [Oceanospirillaceae bacterium]